MPRKSDTGHVDEDEDDVESDEDELDDDELAPDGSDEEENESDDDSVGTMHSCRNSASGRCQMKSPENQIFGRLPAGSQAAGFQRSIRGSAGGITGPAELTPNETTWILTET